MINKKRLFKSLAIISLIIIIIIAAIRIRKTLARYETTTTTERDVAVAFWVVDNTFQTGEITLNNGGVADKLYPRSDAYEYTFTVSNFDSKKTAETDIEYDIVLTTTTNLPLTYEIQRNGTTYTGITQELYKDSNGTVYREMRFGTTTNPYPLVIDTIDDTTKTKSEITDYYTLKVTFPQQSYVNGVLVDNNANLEYPDLIEDIKIELTARQKID